MSSTWARRMGRGLGWLALLGMFGLPGLAQASPGCQALNGLSGTIPGNGYIQLLTNSQQVNQGDYVTLTTSGQIFYGGSFLQMTAANNTVSGTESSSGAGADNIDNLLGSPTNYSITCTSVGASISGVSPSSATVGSTVTLSGSGFWGTTQVFFGAMPATAFSVNYGASPTITATAPNGSGTVTITVVTDAGTYSGGTFKFLPPSAGSASASVAFNSSNNPITLNLGGNPTSVAVASAPSHGTANAAGTAITYTPTTGYTGTDSFTYVASNAAGTSTAATVTITVSPPSAPTVTAASATTAYNTATSINLASAISGLNITGVNIAAAPSHGTVSVSGETVTYTPSATFYGGTDSFTYTATNAGGTSSPATVTVNVGTVGTPTVSGSAATTQYNTPTNINLAGLISGAGITAVHIVNAPSHGTANLSGQTATYTPSATFYGGTDSFTYTATNAGGTSATATITITIGTVPAPTATGKTVTTPYNTSMSIDLSSAIAGTDITGIDIVGSPTHGSASVTGNTVTYTPSATFYGGTDSFTYTAINPGGHSAPATVTITVTPLNGPTAPPLSVATTKATPVLIEAAAVANSTQPLTGASVATQPMHGSATVSGEQILYTPVAGFVGTDSFSYQLSNHFGTSTPGTITVTVTAAGNAAGLRQTVTTRPGSPVTVNLAGIAPGTYASSALLGLSPASAGSTTLSQPATLTFTPASTFHGLVQITAVLISANGQSQVVDVLVLVSSQPDPSHNPDALGLINAQTMQAERFAQNQLSNIQSRLDSLHDGNTSASFSNHLSISLNGKPLQATGDTASSAGRTSTSGTSTPIGARPGMGAAESAMASADTPPQTKAPAPTTQASSGLGVWIDGAANFGSFDAYRQSAGFDSDTIAVNTGVDQRIGEHALVGFSLGYNHDHSDIGNDGTRSVAQGYSAAIYGSYQPLSQVYIDGVLGGGGLRFDSRRYAADSGTGLLGQRNGSQWFASLTAGYEYKTSVWSVSPYGRLAWSLSSLNGYSESGDAAEALAYGAQTVRSSQVVAGIRASGTIPWKDSMFIPHVRLEVGHDFQGTSDTALSYAFVPSAGSWNVLSNPYSANGTTVQAAFGGDLQLSNHLMITTEYEYLLMPHAHDQGIRIGLQKQF
jgi:outer membrane autotransporter protein